MIPAPVSKVWLGTKSASPAYGIVWLAWPLPGADAARNGHGVVGLDVAPGVHTDLVGTVADRSTIDRIFAGYGIEAVIHAGAPHKPDIVRFPQQNFVDVNGT